YLGVQLWVHPDPQAKPLPFDFLSLVVLIGFSLVYVLPFSLFVGGLGSLWRLLAAWTFLPIVVTPLVIYCLFWAFSVVLHGQGMDIFQALSQAYEQKGMPHTVDALGGARVAHAGGPAAIIILVFLIPFVLMDALQLLGDPNVLWQLFQFILCLGGVILLSSLITLVLTLPPLVIVFIKRLKRRYRQFVE